MSTNRASTTDRAAWGRNLFPGAIAVAFLLLPITANAFQAGDRHVHLNGQSLELTWNPLTRSPQSITAVGSDLLEVKDITRLTKKEINDIGALLVSKYGFLLKIRPEHLILRKAEKIDGAWHVNYQQTAHGLVVCGSSLGFSIDPDGHIKSLDAILYPDVRVPGSVKIMRGQALRAAQGRLFEEEKRKYRLQSETVQIYPEHKTGAIDYRQVYIFALFPGDAAPPASAADGTAVFVDAQTGKVVRTRSLPMPQGSCSN